MSHPIIGLTTWRAINTPGQSETRLAYTYTQAILKAGGTPLLIPNHLTDEALRASVMRLDGLLLTGGGDIHPKHYGGQLHPKVSGVDSQRDQTELLLLREAMRNELPFLGICRGIQAINVACDGTLYEDIRDQHDGALKHDYYPDWPRDHLAHEVDIASDSRLAKILNHTQLKVNSLHHQAIRCISTDLISVAIAPDGIIEALELPGHPFGLAVQWHPECLQDHAPMRALFETFVNAADQFRNQRS